MTLLTRVQETVRGSARATQTRKGSSRKAHLSRISCTTLQLRPDLSHTVLLPSGPFAARYPKKPEERDSTASRACTCLSHLSCYSTARIESMSNTSSGLNNFPMATKPIQKAAVASSEVTIDFLDHLACVNKRYSPNVAITP